MLNVFQVKQLNVLAQVLPGVTEVRFRDEDGGEHVAVRVGVGGGWMVDPPGAPECVSLGHSGAVGEPCSYCGEVL